MRAATGGLVAGAAPPVFVEVPEAPCFGSPSQRGGLTVAHVGVPAAPDRELGQLLGCRRRYRLGGDRTEGRERPSPHTRSSRSTPQSETTPEALTGSWTCPRPRPRLERSRGKAGRCRISRERHAPNGAGAGAGVEGPWTHCHCSRFNARLRHPPLPVSPTDDLASRLMLTAPVQLLHTSSTRPRSTGPPSAATAGLPPRGRQLQSHQSSAGASTGPSSQHFPNSSCRSPFSIGVCITH